MTCTSEDWQHIIEDAPHTEMIGKQGLVQEVIRNPDSIHKDADYPDKRRVLYKRLVLPHPWGDCYVRVVIEYNNNPILGKKGWVCTAFASEQKKTRGEVLIWSRN